MAKPKRDLREAIVQLFRCQTGDYLSGEAISEALGVSRTAVWKQIRSLRELGYTIEAVPSRGYRLVTRPDSLLPAEIQADLGTRCIGQHLIFLPQTDSTNRRAHELGEGGDPEGTVIIADQQSAGKGRLGRVWVSPPGVNLYASILLRPPLSPRFAPQLTFVSAVATAHAIAAVSGLSPRVKWPNDILLNGRKVAGLLNEMSAETERIHFVILGIGVNLNMNAEQFPERALYPATSVSLEAGQPVSRLAFVRELLRQLDTLYALFLEQGVAPILAAWEALCDLIGHPVEVDCHDRILHGTAEGLDPDGALRVRLANGQLERVLAGDVRARMKAEG